MDAPFDVVEAMNGILIISLSPCHDGFEAKNLLGSQHNTLKKGMNEKNALKLRLLLLFIISRSNRRRRMHSSLFLLFFHQLWSK